MSLCVLQVVVGFVIPQEKDNKQNTQKKNGWVTLLVMKKKIINSFPLAPMNSEPIEGEDKSQQIKAKCPFYDW